MGKNLEHRLKSTILDVVDFPKPGIVFKDITPVLENAELFGDVIKSMHERYNDRDITAIAVPESRGFIFGSPLAVSLGVPLVLIRKPGKLPRATIAQSYELEYGSDELQIHADAVSGSDRVVIIDDLLATGGTALAACELLEKAGASVEEAAFVVELASLEGRERLGKYAVHSLIVF